MLRCNRIRGDLYGSLSASLTDTRDAHAHGRTVPASTWPTEPVLVRGERLGGSSSVKWTVVTIPGNRPGQPSEPTWGFQVSVRAVDFANVTDNYWLSKVADNMACAGE